MSIENNNFCHLFWSKVYVLVFNYKTNNNFLIKNLIFIYTKYNRYGLNNDLLNFVFESKENDAFT